MNRVRSLEAVVAGSSLALLAPLLWPLLTGRVFVYNDLSWFHLPTRYLYQQAIEAGDTTLWTPSIFAGFYLHGEGQVGLFHPFHELLYRFLPLGPAFNLELIANYPMAFAGMFWFLRRLRCSHPAALFGAMLFAFSGFNLLHHHHLNMVAVVAHLPWMLAAADVLIVEDGHAPTLAFAGMSVLLGSALLLGFPQAVWWNMFALAAFAAFRAGQLRRWRRLAPCGGAIALGIALGGIQWLPSADEAMHSTRMALSADFALTYSLHPFNLLQLWSPYFYKGGAYSEADRMIFHEFGIYSGAILPLALIWVVIRRDALRGRLSLIVASTAFAAGCLVLALGSYGHVGVLLSHLPILQSLRAPARYIVLVQFALTILAAITIDDLIAIGDGRSPAPAGSMLSLWIPPALGIATTLMLNTAVLPYGRHTFASATVAGSGVAIVTAGTLLLYLAARRVRWAIAALVVVTAADLAGWGIRFIYREPAQTITELTSIVPEAPRNPAESYAAVSSGPLARSDLPIMRGYRLTSGYAGLFPATRHPLDSDAWRRLTGTRWLFSADGSRRVLNAGVPRVRLVDEQGHDAAGTASLAEDRPGQIVADVTVPARGVLALTERFHDGWSATVDGSPTQIVRVEEDFLGCAVNAGVHRVRFRFMPRSFVYGSIVSAIGAMLLAGVLIVRLK